MSSRINDALPPVGVPLPRMPRDGEHHSFGQPIARLSIQQAVDMPVICFEGGIEPLDDAL